MKTTLLQKSTNKNLWNYSIIGGWRQETISSLSSRVKISSATSSLWYEHIYTVLLRMLHFSSCHEFYKKQKKSRFNRELGNLSHSRGSRHGSKSSLSWRAIISSAIYSLWYHRIYNVSESWTLAFVAYFKKKQKNLDLIESLGNLLRGLASRQESLNYPPLVQGQKTWVLFTIYDISASIPC